ncbi:MAG: hypothetical protein QNJ31_05365 [Candidatus Caenarcaniphilales bacterium]|nr:hypothetical protein [Candidatus Caenarcaniphilales bacterium]
MSNFKLSSRNIFTWSVIISFFVLVFYYLNLAKSLINVPFALSPIEGNNIWSIITSLSFETDNTIKSFSESLLYIGTISSLLNLNGSSADSMNLTKGLFLGRLISFLSLFLICVSFVLILNREKIKPIISIATLIIFLSIPIVQTFTYQARGELVAVFFGLFAIYNFMPFVRNLSWIRGIIVGSLLALPFIFSHSFAFFSFALSCIVILISVKNNQGLIRLVLPFFSLTTIYLFSIYGIQNSHSFSLFWNGDLFASNFEVLSSWPLFAAIALTGLIWKNSPDFRINPVHPCNTILVFSIILNVVFIGSKVSHSGGWLVSIISLIWMFALILDRVWESNHKKGIQLLTCLIIFITFLTPIMEPLPRKLLLENPQLLIKTKQWLHSHESPENQKSKEAINLSQKILSQDNSLSLLLKANQAHVLNPNSLFRNEKISKRFASLIKNQVFSEIVLAENSSQIWPVSVVKIINRYYVPTKEILVNGSDGLVYEPKILARDSKTSNPNKAHKFSSSTFATFTPLQ